MDSESRKERERLKEEYKEHYRKLNEIRQKGRRVGYIKNVNEALKNLDARDLLSSADKYLDQVREKMAMMEARLDVAIGQLIDQDSSEKEKQEDFEETLRKKRASETLTSLKREMGLLYRELEEQANGYRAEKTIGRQTDEPSDS